MSNAHPTSVIPVGHTLLGTHALEALRGIARALVAAAPAIDLGVRLLAALALLRTDIAALPSSGAVAAILALLLVLGIGRGSIARRIGRRLAAP